MPPEDNEMPRRAATHGARTSTERDDMQDQRTALTGRLLSEALAPGSPAWLRTMSASKIAAVVGTSPYESRFSLWHRMAGLIPGQPDNDTFRRGHYLEPAIAAWFADQHPELLVGSTGTWVHHQHQWAAASPDRIVRQNDGEGSARLLEIKSASDLDGWGKPGTDEIPQGYRDQVVWQMGVTGAAVTHVAVLGPYLRFEEYVVEADLQRWRFLLGEAQRFMDSLPGGPAEQRPDVDAHTETYVALKALHPDIDDESVEIDPALRDQYRTAYAAHKDAEAAQQLATNLVAAKVGQNKRATCDGENVAVRVAGRFGAPPYLKSSPIRTQQKAA